MLSDGITKNKKSERLRRGRIHIINYCKGKVNKNELEKEKYIEKKLKRYKTYKQIVGKHSCKIAEFSKSLNMFFKRLQLFEISSYLIGGVSRGLVVRALKFQSEIPGSIPNSKYR